ncbi:hypothetical protein CPAR01_08277 [Colletotrichum paranaense]|uniref:Uncharacterized protein n=1 Tax=Colletotrichum paranaense TaxID=1914294 RepID=A0ABQ9SJV0_9PEZI|nr:uncharacterized protein CPAR01_08277 [Colletotrichum paranaense]KAK1538164.1 hypothetical protein CPAR01_08277 [Colletotrichum paranaense]
MVAMARRTGSTEPHHTQSHTRLGSQAMEICHPQGFRMEPHFTAPTGVEKLEVLEAWTEREREREANEHPPAPPADRNLPRTTPRRVRNLQTAKIVPSSRGFHYLVVRLFFLVTPLEFVRYILSSTS